MPNKRKNIGIIIHRTDESMCQNLLNSLADVMVPDGYEVIVTVLDNSSSKAASYNEGMQQINGEIKLYIDESAIIVNKNILKDIVRFFETNPEDKMLGLFGSEMPINGDYSESQNCYGIYGYTHNGENINLNLGKKAIWKQNVACIDSMFVATSSDIEWDDAVGEEFLIAAQCCRFREKHYGISVPMQDMPWCAYYKKSSYSEQSKDFEKARLDFFDKYKNIIQPLVSILITTYNQPVFFKEALESALHQDYYNIEIVIGDDSTNTDTKNLMREYIRKYPQIKYYYHNGPLGGQGLENAKFVLNHSNGSFINYLFHDDLFYPQKISTMMKYMVRDFNEQIGMISSARNLIDENGVVQGQINPWQPIDNEVLNGMEMAEKILYSSQNYIGELTTVLLRKKLLKQNNGEYLMGCFNGVRDKANGDVATWLDVARQGKNCLFLKDVLSCFRRHSGQNTYNVTIIVNSIIDWLNYITIFGWLDIHKKNTEELSYYYDRWYLVHKKNISYVCKFIKSEKMEIQDKVRFCIKVLKLIERREYQKVRELSQKYIRLNYENLSIGE